MSDDIGDGMDHVEPAAPPPMLSGAELNFQVRLLRMAVMELKAASTSKDAQIAELHDEIDLLKSSLRDERERNLKWGISVLGGAFVTLLGIVWGFRATIVGGGQ